MYAIGIYMPESRIPDTDASRPSPGPKRRSAGADMTDKSLAAVLVAPNQFEVREIDIPELPDDAGLLKIEACGICGSDARIRTRVANGPVIMGHENVGT